MSLDYFVQLPSTRVQRVYLDCDLFPQPIDVVEQIISSFHNLTKGLVSQSTCLKIRLTCGNILKSGRVDGKQGASETYSSGDFFHSNDFDSGTSGT